MNVLLLASGTDACKAVAWLVVGVVVVAATGATIVVNDAATSCVGSSVNHVLTQVELHVQIVVGITGA